MNNLQVCQKLFSEMLDLKSLEEGFAAERFNALLNENNRLPGVVAMDIYRNNSIGAKQRALEQVYPVMVNIIGERCFNTIAHQFVTAAPSLNADLNSYGEAFPEFLMNLVVRQAAFVDFVYLPDLARLEWFYHAAYYALDDKPISEQLSYALASENEKTISLVRSRALFYLITPYPVYAIWQSHRAGEGINEVTPLADEECLLVYRRQGHPEIERINRDELNILEELAVVRDIESVVACALEKGVEIQQALPGMIQKGWIRITDN